MKKAKEESYLGLIQEYQEKMYLSGYYTGGKTHPILKSKTKLGGYFLIIAGYSLFGFYLFQLINNFSIENTLWLIPMLVAILLVVVGIKFVKLNKDIH